MRLRLGVVSACALFSFLGAARSQAATEPVSWIPSVGASASGNTLTKTGSGGWNTGAISCRALASGNGILEFRAAAATTNRVCGLSHGDDGVAREGIRLGILLSDDATFSVIEDGFIQGVFGSYQAGDRFQVAVESG